jgi:hypothetical protein
MKRTSPGRAGLDDPASIIDDIQQNSTTARTNMSKGFKKLFFNKYVWLLFIPLLIGWLALTHRLQERTDFATYRQMQSVMRIWGGNLEQPMPSVRYKSFGSDVSSLGKKDLHASDVSVKLQVDYRKKGLVYYTGYVADFIGKYTITNTEAEKIYLSFIFPYPMKQGEGMLRDVKLLVNNQEDMENTEYQEELLLWTGALEPSASVEMTVQYTGRGLKHFVYGFEPGRQINRFKMQMEIAGASDVDYPVSTMTPTRVEETPEGKRLIWDLESVLTQLNIGVVLPDRINIAKQISVMTMRSPAFFLLFLGALFALFAITAVPLSFIQIAIVSIAFFLFYPLFAYLSMYMDAVASFAVSFGILGALLFNYARNVYGLKIAAAICVAYTFFLGITSIAALLPTYSGLIYVIEGVVVLAIAMHVLSRRRELTISDLWSTFNNGKEDAPEILLTNDLSTDGEKDENR